MRRVWQNSMPTSRLKRTETRDSLLQSLAETQLARMGGDSTAALPTVPPVLRALRGFLGSYEPGVFGIEGF